MRIVDNDYKKEYITCTYYSFSLIAPKWVKCIATDKDGKVWGYSSKDIYVDPLFDVWSVVDPYIETYLIKVIPKTPFKDWQGSKVELDYD